MHWQGFSRRRKLRLVNLNERNVRREIAKKMLLNGIELAKVMRARIYILARGSPSQ